jgi:CSLREA domain-containing protein
MKMRSELRAVALLSALALLAGCQDRTAPTAVEINKMSGVSLAQSASSPVVNSLADPGDGTCDDVGTGDGCTLREAIAFATAGATITFDPQLTSGGPATITLLTGQLVIDKSLAIAGPGAKSLTVARSAAAPLFRNFAVAAGTTVGLSNFSISNGQTNALLDGGGGGVLNGGNLTVHMVTFSGNQGGTSGGAILNQATGILLLTSSTLSGNSASFSGGAISNLGSATIINSTVSGNTSHGAGPCCFDGGAVLNVDGSLTVHYSTITDNAAPGDRAGGVKVFGGTVTVIATIIADNTTFNCAGTVTDGGYNVDDGTTCGLSAATGSKPSTDPELGILADNGGSANTHALPAGSPAIDAIPNGTIGCGTTVTADQRGTTRPESSACDIGAFEFVAPADVTPPTITIATPTDGGFYLLGQQVLSDYSCVDEAGGSGVALCNSMSPSGTALNTATPGLKQFTVNAADNAGNQNSATAQYGVTYNFSGFAPPVSGGTVPNVVKAGRTIPLNWRLLDGNDNPITTLATVNVSVTPSADCPAGITNDLAEEQTAGKSGLQNLGDGYYQYNVATPRSYANSCKILHLDLGEGVTRTALFLFRK